MAKTNPIQRLQEAVDDLNQILRGASNETVNIDGVTKPTLSAVAAEYVYNHGIQPDVATGIIAVGEGGVFTVPSAGKDLLVMYRVIDGEAEEIGRAPSSAIADDVAQVAGLIGSSDSEFAWAVRDGFNRIAACLDRDGKFLAVEVEASESLGIEGFKTVPAKNAAEGPLTIRGEDGSALLNISPNGVLRTLDVYAQGAVSVPGGSLAGADQVKQGSGFFLCGDGGLREVILYIDGDSVMHASSIDVKNDFTWKGRPLADAIQEFGGATSPPVELTGYVHLPMYGQSQMTGSQGQPAINTEENPYALMFSGGVWNATDTSEKPEGFYDAVALRERDTGVYGETPASQMAYQLAEYYPDAVNVDFQLFATNSAHGGRSAAQLLPGTVYHDLLLEAFDEAYNRAQEAGRSYSAPMFFYWQGGTDESLGTGFDEWREQVGAIWESVKEKVSEKAGSKQDMPMMLFQTTNFYNYGNGTGSVGRAQLWFAETYDNCFCVPVYWATNEDSVHHDNVTYARCGAYQAIFLREHLAGGEKFEGVRPLSWSRQGRVLSIKFSQGHGGLQFWDGPAAAPISAVENYGFTAVDSAGAPVVVESVRIEGSDRVSIVAARDWLATDRIQYAVTDNGDGGRARVGGQRGWLFDRNGDRDSVTIEGEVYPLHIPCVQFDKELG